MIDIKFPLAKDTFDRSDIEALCEWMLQNPTPKLTMGELTKEFEKKIAEWVGRKYAVLCNSGSSANLLAIYALKIIGKLKNNKCVVPSVAWATSIAPFINFGFDKPIMVGADKNNFGMDLDELEIICERENPAVVLFVQPLGVLCDKNRLLQLKNKYGFYLIEDGCAAVTSHYVDGTKSGAVGDISTWSLFFGHQVSTVPPEGGVVFTDDKEIYNHLLMLRSHGFIRDLDDDSKKEMVEKYNISKIYEQFSFIVPGMNLRPTDLMAFVGLRQISKLDSIGKKRHENHIFYKKQFEGSSMFQVQEVEQNNVASISFAVLASSEEHRKIIVRNLKLHGIETRIYSAGNMGKSVFWKNLYGEYSHPISDRIHSCGLFLPNYISLSKDDIEFICNIVKTSHYCII